MSNCPYLNFADHNPDNCEHCSPSGGSNPQAGDAHTDFSPDYYPERRVPTSATGETPRSDAMEVQLGKTDCCFIIEPEFPTLMEFARQLERELADTNRQREEQQYLAITRGEALDRLRSARTTGKELPAELFDGYAVWKALGDHSGVSRHNVSAVLDAVVRLIRSRS